MATDKLLIKYRARDSFAGVTRGTVKALMDALDMTATQVVHIALSRFAVEVLPAYESDDGPLTSAQLKAVSRRAKGALPRGEVVADRSLFG